MHNLAIGMKKKKSKMERSNNQAEKIKK